MRDNKTIRVWWAAVVLSMAGCSETGVTDGLITGPSALPEAAPGQGLSAAGSTSTFRSAASYPSPTDCELVGVMKTTWPGRNWRATSPTLVNVTDGGYATWGIPAWVTGWDSTSETVTVQYYKWRLRYRSAGSRWDGWSGWTRENGRSVQVPMGEVGRYQFQVAACVKQSLPSGYSQDHWMVVTQGAKKLVRVY